MKNQNYLITALKILGIFFLLPIVISCGWIIGAIWLVFFRKKLNYNPEKQKNTTFIVSILSALSLMVMLFLPTTHTSLETIEISSNVSGQELETNQDYIIDVTYKPEDTSNPNFTYNIDNSCATFKESDDDHEKAILHTKSEGTVTISVSSSTINSNSLAFTIVDNTKDTVEIDKENINDEKTRNDETEESQEAAEKPAESSTENDESEKPQEPEESSEEKYPEVINDDINITFSESVQNDTTSNYRLARVTTTKKIQEYALEYHNSYFQSDHEIHTIVNSTRNTTNKLTKITPGTLDVFVYDYVDNEELDANTLFTGTPIAHYEINISSADITEIPLETDAAQTDTAAEPASDNVDTAAEPENETEAEPEAPPETTEMVWLSATGEKYHSIPNCGRMNPNNARQVTKDQAVSQGFGPCSKCH